MMVPTQEQVECVELAVKHKLLKINAKAGSGKTSTLMMISDAIKKPSLYLAYNKSMANEAKNKFPNHVTVNTVHGLAYRFIGKDYAHKLSRPVGRYVNVACTGSEIGKYYKLPDLKAGNNELGEARIVNKNYLGLIIRDTTNKFEQSDDKFLEYKHVPQHHIKDITKRYPDLDIKKLNKMLVNYAKRLWDDRTDVMSDVLCTHDTYLKLFELSSPVLEDYDVVYLDESQDSNSVTLSIFMNQSSHAKLILVGDNRQQIYGWRGAENAMKKIDCPEAVLSKSFRFGEKIAGVATAIIKEPVTGNEAVNSIIGEFDVIDYEQPYTILFRKNSTLVYKALDLIQDGIKVSINIDLKDFVSMLTSALELSTGNIKKVKHENIIPYSNWGELVEEAKSVPELARMVAIIKNDRAAEIIQTLHNYKVDARDVQITLTTAHKSKGLEFNYVLLADDFPSPYNDKGEYVGLTTEEENLLYVSATRAKRVLQYNPTVTTLLTLSGYTTERNVKTS